MFGEFSAAAPGCSYPHSPWVSAHLVHGPAVAALTHAQGTGMECLPPGPCTQSPAGVTGCLGGRQKCPKERSCSPRKT